MMHCDRMGHSVQPTNCIVALLVEYCCTPSLVSYFCTLHKDRLAARCHDLSVAKRE